MMKMTGSFTAHSVKIRTLIAIVLVFASCLLSSCSAGGQPPTGNYNPVTKSPLELSDYDVYSWTRDAEFSRLNSDQQLERINIATFQQEGSETTFMAVKTASSGDIYAVGQAATWYGSHESDDVLLQGLVVRYDRDLNQTGFIMMPDIFSCSVVVVDSEGFVYTVGYGYSDESHNCSIIKYDAELNEVSHCAAPEMFFSSAGLTADGCLLLCGSSRVGDIQGDTNGLIARYSTDLELLDSVTWDNDRFDCFERFVIGSDGSVYITGLTGASSGAGQAAVILKYDSSLYCQKTVTIIEYSHSNQFTALAVGSDDSIFAAYNSYDSDTGGAFVSNLIIRYSTDLEILGSLHMSDVFETFPEYLPASFMRHYSFVRSLAVDQNGFLYCIGCIGSISKSDVTVVILDNDLSVVNSASWVIANETMFNVYNVDLADDGSVCVVGSEYHPRISISVPIGITLPPPDYVRAVIIK